VLPAHHVPVGELTPSQSDLVQGGVEGCDLAGYDLAGCCGCGFSSSGGGVVLVIEPGLDDDLIVVDAVGDLEEEFET